MNVKQTWAGISALVLSTAAFGADLTVTVSGLKAPGGQLNVSLFSTEASWNDEGRVVEAQQVEVHEEIKVVVFENLAPGTYAIRLMHDENGNGKLDTNLFGIPKEGWGHSNNPRTIGPAKWEQAVFDLGDEDRTIVITAR